MHVPDALTYLVSLGAQHGEAMQKMINHSGDLTGPSHVRLTAKAFPAFAHSSDIHMPATWLFLVGGSGPILRIHPSTH